MKYRLFLPLTSVLAGVAGAEPANQTIKGLDECFAQTRTADTICDGLASNASARLECLQKSRNAQQECLEHLRAGLTIIPPPASPEPKPEIRTTPETAPDRIPKPEISATPPPEGTGSVNRGPVGDSPPQDQDTREPVTPPSPVATSPSQQASSPPPEPRAPSTSSWIVSQTTSPIDYSPSLVAELRSQSASKPDAPSVLVLRCRAGLSEISVRTQGVWRRTRLGDIEVVLTSDDRPAERFRWELSPDGKNAYSLHDAAKILPGLSGGRLTVAANDVRGEAGASTFDLTGIQAVREKLAATCR